ncbi:MAG: hypothetical protein ACREFK_03985 [Stellaceae bacterium]
MTAHIEIGEIGPSPAGEQEHPLVGRLAAVADAGTALSSARSRFAELRERHSDLVQRVGRPPCEWAPRHYRALLAATAAACAAATWGAGVLGLAPGSVPGRWHMAAALALGLAEGVAAALLGHFSGRWVRRSRSSRSALGRLGACAGGAGLVLAALAVPAALALSADRLPVMLTALGAVCAALGLAVTAWRAHDPEPGYAAAAARLDEAESAVLRGETRYDREVAAARRAFEEWLASAAERCGRGTALSPVVLIEADGRPFPRR